MRSRKSGEWFVHESLRARMVEDARVSGSSLSDVANRILCAHFDLPYEQMPQRAAPREGGDNLNFRVSVELDRAVSERFGKHRLDGVRKVLCAYYGIPAYERPKLTRARRSVPAAA